MVIVTCTLCWTSTVIVGLGEMVSEAGVAVAVAVLVCVAVAVAVLVAVGVAVVVCVAVAVAVLVCVAVAVAVLVCVAVAVAVLVGVVVAVLVGVSVLVGVGVAVFAAAPFAVSVTAVVLYAALNVPPLLTVAKVPVCEVSVTTWKVWPAVGLKLLTSVTFSVPSSVAVPFTLS